MSCAGLIACGGDPEPSAPTRRSKRGPILGSSETSDVQPGSAAMAPPGPALTAMGPLPTTTDPAATAAPAAPPEQEAPAQDEAPRDFGAELARLVGNPADCLQPRPSSDGLAPIHIAIDTRVMPSGAVASSQVRAPGLTPSELQCITRRVEGVHLAQPIPGAPLGIHTSIALAPSPAKPAPQPLAAQARDTQRPAAALGAGLFEPNPEPAPVVVSPPSAANDDLQATQ